MKRSEITNPYDILLRLPMSEVLNLAWGVPWYGLEENVEFARAALAKPGETPAAARRPGSCR